MCKKVRCDVCKKYTYEGCGRHVEEVLKDIPKEERCDGKCVHFPDDELFMS
jgi:hypothetical protein